MKIERKDLEQRFEQLSDEYLVDRLQSGKLTEMASEVVTEELRKRGISIARVAPEEVAETEANEPVLSEDMVEIARVLSPTEAHILEARLIAEGIPAVVADAHLVQAHYFLALAVGGVRVLVPESFAGAAHDVKAAIARGEYALPDDKLEQL